MTGGRRPDAPGGRSGADLSLADRGAIKGWLLNQQGVSGLGNIYADEALFEARIHPLAQPEHVSPAAARRLYRAVKKVLKRAVNLQGTTFRDYIDIEGRPGNFLQRLRVYQKTRQPCPRCHRPIRRIVIAGRSSHYCPRCQRRPRHTATMPGSRTSSRSGPEESQPCQFPPDSGSGSRVRHRFCYNLLAIHEIIRYGRRL